MWGHHSPRCGRPASKGFRAAGRRRCACRLLLPLSAGTAFPAQSCRPHWISRWRRGFQGGRRAGGCGWGGGLGCGPPAQPTHGVFGAFKPADTGASREGGRVPTGARSGASGLALAPQGRLSSLRLPRGSCPGLRREGLPGPGPDTGSRTRRPSPAASPAPNPRAEGPRAGPPAKPSPLAPPQALGPPARAAPQAAPRALPAPTPPRAAAKSSAVSSGAGRAGAGARLKPEASPAEGARLPRAGVGPGAGGGPRTAGHAGAPGGAVGGGARGGVGFPRACAAQAAARHLRGPVGPALPGRRPLAQTPPAPL